VCVCGWVWVWVWVSECVCERERERERESARARARESQRQRTGLESRQDTSIRTPCQCQIPKKSQTKKNIHKLKTGTCTGSCTPYRSRYKDASGCKCFIIVILIFFFRKLKKLKTGIPCQSQIRRHLQLKTISQFLPQPCSSRPQWGAWGRGVVGYCPVGPLHPPA
jgi:hypothetical protein